MDSKSTPGPWRIQAGLTGGTDVVADRELLICHLDPDDGDPAGSECTDACLIAAAPDLFAACRLAVAQIERLTHWDGMQQQVIETARAAIARAEGR